MNDLGNEHYCKYILNKTLDANFEYYTILFLINLYFCLKRNNFNNIKLQISIYTSSKSRIFRKYDQLGRYLLG